jgi:hypothetical protein
VKAIVVGDDVGGFDVGSAVGVTGSEKVELARFDAESPVLWEDDGMKETVS